MIYLLFILAIFVKLLVVLVFVSGVIFFALQIAISISQS